jgi:hypothetical protein
LNLRNVIIVIAIIIIVVNLVIFVYPFNDRDIEAQLHKNFNEIITTNSLDDPDFLLITELQSESYTLSDQIRKKIHDNSTITIKSIEKKYCTVEIKSPKLDSLIEDIFSEFEYESSKSFNENKIALLEEIYSQIITTEIEYRNETINVEYIKGTENYEVVLNREFYNALYGGLMDLLQTNNVAFITEGENGE